MTRELAQAVGCGAKAAMTSPATAQPRDLKAEVNNLKVEGILAAATTLFSQRGYGNCTMDDIAHSIGVTKPFVYYRFKDKADILAAICERGARLTHAAIVDALDRPGSCTDRLRGFCESFALAVIERADFITVYKREVSNLRPDDRRAITELRRETDQLVRALLTQGQDAGEFEPIDARIAASSITGMLSFIVDWYRPRSGIAPDDVVHTTAELAMRMAGARH
jgi:TetR/AcrR family transcriptional regulator, cholesterol catabolism regulator